jgi:primary-amine oxidase
MKITKHPEGTQPAVAYSEYPEIEQAVANDPEFKLLLKELYGVNDTSLVMVDVWSSGYYGAEEEKNKRLVRPLCYLRNDPTDNGYARPIEGLKPVVDLNLMKVIYSYGTVP